MGFIMYQDLFLKVQIKYIYKLFSLFLLFSNESQCPSSIVMT